MKNISIVISFFDIKIIPFLTTLFITVHFLIVYWQILFTKKQFKCFCFNDCENIMIISLGFTIFVLNSFCYAVRFIDAKGTKIFSNFVIILKVYTPVFKYIHNLDSCQLLFHALSSNFVLFHSFFISQMPTLTTFVLAKLHHFRHLLSFFILPKKLG